jgi:hypothetical protein
MSDPLQNPYAPPQAAARGYGDIDAPLDTREVPDIVLAPLRATRPWVTFLAIVGFIGAGLLALGGLVVMGSGGMGTGSSRVTGWIGLVYLVFGALYIFPSLHLLRFGSAIARLDRDPHMERLGAALGHQRAFWKLIGIVTAVMVALYPIAIIGGLVAAVALRSR